MTGPARPGEDFTFVAWPPGTGNRARDGRVEPPSSRPREGRPRTSCTSRERIPQYPRHPDVKVTRGKRRCGSSERRSPAQRAALTSYGELTKIIGRGLAKGRQPATADVPVTRAIWVAWDAERSPIGPNARQRDRRGRRIGQHHRTGCPRYPAACLGNLSDRSGSGLCPSVRRAHTG